MLCTLSTAGSRFEFAPANNFIQRIVTAPRFLIGGLQPFGHELNVFRMLAFTRMPGRSAHAFILLAIYSLGKAVYRSDPWPSDTTTGTLPNAATYSGIRGQNHCRA